MLKNILESVSFSSHPHFFAAPARINIIGEHVDYLGGLVLPAAIQFQTIVGISKLEERKFELHSVKFGDSLVLNSFEYQKEKKWANYILGVLDEIEKLGYKLPGLQIVVDGNIPQGAGLSSSASLEVAVGYSVSEICNLGLSKKDIALVGQRAENNFVGTKCGIMDQFVIALAKTNTCLILDTSNLEYSYKLINIGSCEFFLIDSKVKHSLETSDYNKRREECESALKKIQEKISIPNLYSLPENNNLQEFNLTKEEIKRVQHVIGEKRRTQDAIHFLESNRPEQLGNILYEAHNSLANFFEVSCEETDFIVDRLRNEGCLGARMIGGGFGGCILVLDKIGKFERIANRIYSDYSRQFGIQPEFYKIQITDGVKEI
jgi:galactokinase